MKADRAQSPSGPLPGEEPEHGPGPPAPRPAPLRAYALVVVTGWTVLIAASLFWNLEQEGRTILDLAAAEARMAIEKDVVYRRWNADLGGVYVKRSERAPSNPYLKVPERDVTTSEGKQLTLINPAYMTRQAHEQGLETMGMRGHITSLKPLRPENAPDPWEAAALKSFEAGSKEAVSGETIADKPYLRLMRPLRYEEACRPCHQTQGYEVGQVRGGISVSVPLGPHHELSRPHQITMIVTHSAIWLLGLLGAWLAVTGLGRRQEERDRAQREREAALNSLIEARNQVKILSGLLPICASCKKIRDEDGRWQAVESYIHGHSQADFTHSICPDCYNRLYPELAGAYPAKSEGS